MNKAGIPKIIHYCWFGKKKKNDLINRCIKSWHATCPQFVIKEWNEENYDVSSNPFTQQMYNEGRWAFVADYVRLEILEREGGYYLDTDMLLLRMLPHPLHAECILGEEESGIISAGMMASIAHHPFIQKAKNYYDTNGLQLATIPRILTSVYGTLENKEGVVVYPPHTFYPFDQNTIKNYAGQKLPNDVYGVHLWNFSWGHPLNKFFRKIGIYSFGKKITEILGIKKIIKKILGFI